MMNLKKKKKHKSGQHWGWLIWAVLSRRAGMVIHTGGVGLEITREKQRSR